MQAASSADVGRRAFAHLLMPALLVARGFVYHRRRSQPLTRVSLFFAFFPKEFQAKETSHSPPCVTLYKEMKRHLNSPPVAKTFLTSPVVNMLLVRNLSATCPPPTPIMYNSKNGMADTNPF